MGLIRLKWALLTRLMRLLCDPIYCKQCGRWWECGTEQCPVCGSRWLRDESDPPEWNERHGARPPWRWQTREGVRKW